MSFDALHKLLTNCIRQKNIAGCVCWIGDDKNTFFFRSYGYAQKVPTKEKMNRDTIFDLASITKPMSTAMSIMQLDEKKTIRLNHKIKKYLPNFEHKPNGEKTIKELLTHTSGIPAWFPVYLLPQEHRMNYLATANTGKSNVIYSCLGYLILAKIVEAVSACRLDEYCRRCVYKKMGLKNTMFGPVKRKNIAATEFGNKYEKKIASKHGDVSEIPWRNYVIKGEVHDGNAYYGFNGVAGNAGLFSNARDLAEMTRYYLAGEIINKKTLTMMTTDWTGGEERRGLGWVVNPFPKFLSSPTFYHTGFTGTMLLVSPKQNLIIILLMNAVHPTVRLKVMPPIREKVVRIISKIFAL